MEEESSKEKIKETQEVETKGNGGENVGSQKEIVIEANDSISENIKLKGESSVLDEEVIDSVVEKVEHVPAEPIIKLESLVERPEDSVPVSTEVIEEEEKSVVVSEEVEAKQEPSCHLEKKEVGLKEAEEARVVTLEENFVGSPGDPVEKPIPDTLNTSEHATTTTISAAVVGSSDGMNEATGNPPLVSQPPVQTSWKNCCRLFEARAMWF